jgi:NAD(P)-dependent dehydrogenase (short-subunit alcohol dehydrogenase family)
VSLTLFSLEGRVVSVTGAGSGLGRAISEAAAEAGADVACCDIDPGTAEETAAAIRASGGSAMALVMDVTDEGSVETTTDAVVAAHGRLDVLFANAGTSDHYLRADELDLERWQRVIAVNLTGAFLTAKHALRHMVRQRSGKIVFTASLWGHIGSDTVPVPAYAASKGGVINLTRELAQEFAELGVTVNAISPGFFDTNIGRDKRADPATIARLREGSIRASPIHRRATPDEIKGTAVYLASAASDHVNGHILLVDAGAHAR